MKTNGKEAIQPLSNHRNLAEFLKLWLCAAQIEVSIIQNRIVEIKVLKPYIMELRQ